MKNILKVFKFELESALNEKSIRIATIIILLMVFGATFIPRIIHKGEEKTFIEKTPDEQIEELGKVGYVILTEEVVTEEINKYLPFSLGEEYESEEKIKEDLLKEKLKSGIVIIKKDKYKLLKQGSDIMFSETISQLVESELLKYNQNQFYLKNNIDPNMVAEAGKIVLTSEVEEVGKSAQNNYFIAYFGTFILYFMIIMYGVSTATSVAREKSDRTMELLITNTSSTSLIVGKVISALVVGIAQIVLMLVVGYIGFMINKSTYPEMIISILNQNISFKLISVFLTFGIIGSLLYYFIYAALGSLVTRVEDASSAIGPIQMIFVGAFMFTMMGMMNPTSRMFKIGSFIPFSSPMAMFARYSMVEVSLLELLLSLLILILTTIFIAYITIKIYRRATLNYGNKLSLIQEIKNLRKNE